MTSSRIKLMLPVVAAMLAAVLLLSWQMSIQLSSTRSLAMFTQDIYEHPFTVTRAASKISTNIQHIRENIVETIISHPSNSRLNAIEKADQSFSDDIDLQIPILRAQFLGDQDRVSNLIRAIEYWKKIRAEVYRAAHDGRQKQLEEIINTKGIPTVIEITSELDYVLDFAFKKATSFANTSLQQSEATAKSSSLIGFTLFLTLVAIGFITIFLIIRMMRKIENSNDALLQVQQQNKLALEAERDKLDQLVTERTQELNQMMIKAQQASQAKSQFLAAMSHEIRTPMNAVLGFLQLLEQTKQNPIQLEYTQKAYLAGKTLLGILNDILDFSKIEASKLELRSELFKLDDLLRGMAVVLSGAIHNKNVEILLHIDPNTPRSVVGDAMRLEQVLLNLCGNAIKFTETGEIVLSVKLIQSSENSTLLEFSVRDTGIGIPENRLHAIFESFTQADASTSRRYGGTGLGLAISQRLVTMMGGELLVESSIGQGSTFHFAIEFPKTQTSSTAPTRSPSIAINQQLRVLIADDNEAARQILTEMARSFNWETETVCSGVQAIERLQQEDKAGRPFDVLCIDWMMPEMDGWETVKHIRNHSLNYSSIAVLMVTAHGRELVLERISAEEEKILDGFIVKPFTSSMLFDAVSTATHGRSASTGADCSINATTKPLSGIHVLLVEDNQLNQYVAQQMLEHAGATITVAHNGRHAVEAVKISPSRFDVILMDIQMPEMDGYEATKILRSNGYRQPILAMTANAMSSDKEACIAAGMNEHIGKPFDMNQVIRIVRKYCAIHTDHITRKVVDAPETPSTNDAHHVKRLDLDSALKRLGGNQILYTQIANHFISDDQTLLREAEDQLRQGNYLAAERNIHTLKGIAATLGDVRLSRAAEEVELRCREHASSVEIEPVLMELREQLAQTLRELAVIMKNIS